MSILVINSGSSSIKFRLFSSLNSKLSLQAYGMADAIGLPNSRLILENERISVNQQTTLANHATALRRIFQALQGSHLLSGPKDLQLIGHRVVHGGEKYSKPTLVTPVVLRELKKLAPLAPLHNPANIACIEACGKIFPKLPQVAAFDTAFHQTMPETSYLYALPLEDYRQYGLRRYGFHGINHQYVHEEAQKILRGHKMKRNRIITIHLGNGCSMTAIKNGRSLENSMGYTPLEGLPMGTRSGDVDPALVGVIATKRNCSLAESIDYLNRQCGLLGLSGLSSDMRTIWAAARRKNPRALLTMDIYARRIAKYLNDYIGLLGGVDAIVFTAGIGEHAWYIRQRILSYVRHLEIKASPKLNQTNKTIFSVTSSRAALLIVPANEELEIARQSLKMLHSHPRQRHSRS